MVWTYGLHWEEENGKLVSKAIEPKLPIPDYRNIPFLPDYNSQLQLKKLHHIYSHSESSNNNILKFIWNLHDAEHFASTHRNTMLTKEVEIAYLSQNDNKFSWQLIMSKRDDDHAKSNKMNFILDEIVVQSFNTFLPSFALVTTEFRGVLVVRVITFYPESPHSTKFCLDTYLHRDINWWQKLLKLSNMGDTLRDRLISEDVSILNNLYPTFDKKIALKNDTPAELAMTYLQSF